MPIITSASSSYISFIAADFSAPGANLTNSHFSALFLRPEIRSFGTFLFLNSSEALSTVNSAFGM